MPRQSRDLTFTTIETEKPNKVEEWLELILEAIEEEE